MSGTLDWIGIHGWTLVERCRVSEATVMQVFVSGCLLECLEDGWRWKVPVAFLLFISLFISNFIGGYQHDTGDELGVGGPPI